MSSRTALRRERVAQAVLDGAVGNLSRVTEKLNRRFEEDGLARALETGMQPAVPVERLSAEAAEVVTALQTLQEEMAPTALPDWSLVQKVVASIVAFYTSNYMVLDDIHQQEASEEWVPRDVRDQAVETAYKDMLAVRRYVAGVLDPRAADSLLGLRGSTATQPVELRRQMQSAIRRLRDPKSHIPDSRIEGLEPDWEPAIRQLERSMENLDEALQGLAAESAAEAHARARRDAALAAHRDAVTGSGFMLRGLYTMAGERDLLDSIRSPFARRSADEPAPEENDDFPFDEPFGEEDDDIDDDIGDEEGVPASEDAPEGEEVEP